MNARRLTLMTLASLCALVGAFAFSAAPALAARGHVFKESLAAPCAAAPCAPGTLKEPAGLAISEATGDLYVADAANNRVERFSSSGAFLGQFNGGATFEPEPGVTESATEAGHGGNPGEIETGSFALEPFSSQTASVAVDNSCSRHQPSLTELTTPTCAEFDPSYGDVYVTDIGHHVIDKFGPRGEYLSQIAGTPAGSFETLNGLAVDATGQLWVADEVKGRRGVFGGQEVAAEEGVDAFTNAAPNAFQSFRPTFERGFPGFALDSKADFYVHKDFSENVSGEFVEKYGSAGSANGTTLAHVEFPESEAVTDLAIEAATDDLYVDNTTRVSRFAPDGLEAEPIETFGSPQLSKGAGVALDEVTATVYVADSAAGVIDVFGLAPPSLPSVESDGVSEVASTSATLEAEVNPRGKPTEYRFEYGICASASTCASSPYEHSAPSPDAPVGSDFEIHSLSVHLQGLAPHTAYHFLALAHNELGRAEGKEVTFTTQGAGGSLLLPDARQWELVSPPGNGSGQIQTINASQVTEAAAAGGAITYLSNAPTEASPQGNAAYSQILSARGPSGWLSRDISTPHEFASGVGGFQGQEYRFFSPDLSAAILNPLGAFNAVISPQGSEQTAYLRTDFPAAEPTAFCSGVGGHCYTPLVSGKEGFANVPPGTVFRLNPNGEECPPSFRLCGPQFEAATPDLSHIVLSYRPAGLTATPGDEGGLYEWSAGQLGLISWVPPGAETACGPGGPACVPAPAPSSSYSGVGNPQTGSASARNAISAAGTRVFWGENTATGHLYLRDTASEETLRLDVPQGGSGEGEVAPHFRIASADGSRVFFTDSQALAPGSSSNSQGGTADLYECEIHTEAGHLACALTDLTPEHGGEAAGVSLERTLIGASEDGSYIYFAANGALAPGAQPAACNSGKAAASCNVYLRHYDGSAWEAPRLVAVLSAPADRPSTGGEGFGEASLTSRVSPNGRWLAFMSERPLTGYDNHDARTGKPDEEVFLYHAPAGPGAAGRLICASCNPTGARPVGAEFTKLASGLDGAPTWFPQQGLAASIPSWTTFNSSISRYQSRYLSDSGRLFFNATDSLVPQDSNGTGDVYQYEPPQGGEAEPPSDTCTTSSLTYSPASQGCVDLISSGTSAEESGFLDASESGSDVFFFTNAKLSAQDADTSRHVYDAHACTAASPCPPPPPPAPPACAGDACQSPVGAPNDATPGSLTFSGPGNVASALTAPAKKTTKKTVKCKKARKLRHGKCVKTKAKRKAKKATTNRRARS
jgi:DNA-binding beta-propeller fold protein YncE